jgi:hypothetical protein
LDYPRIEPWLLDIPEAQLEERAAQELARCPALIAFLFKRLDETGAEYDTASNMEQVTSIRGKRNILNRLMGLPGSVESRKLSEELREKDLSELDLL